MRLPPAHVATPSPDPVPDRPAWPMTGEGSSAAAHDDPFARASAPLGAERTIPDLALEETERYSPPVRPAPEPWVASRDPGLLDFGEVDLAAGPDAFRVAPGNGLDRASPPPDLMRSPAGAEDPLAGLSLDDLAPGDRGAHPSTLLPPQVEAPPLASPPPAEPLARPPQPPAPRPAAADLEQDVAAEADRARRRLRTVGVNALSLIALLAVAAVLFQVWRARQQVDPEDRASGPAVAMDVSSEPYDTASGKPVVVTRGRVRASAPLRTAEVRVELLDGGRVVAAGTALAGALPSAEEVHAVGSLADAEVLVRSIASRAPARIAAGEVLPFIAVVADAPADLRPLEVRVSLRTEPLTD